MSCNGKADETSDQAATPADGEGTCSDVNVNTAEIEGKFAQCPDSQCLAFMEWSTENEVQCDSCGQVFDAALLCNAQSINLRPKQAKKRTFFPPELVEINGYSNLECRLITPLLTAFGLDKDGGPRPIGELNAAKRRSKSCSNQQNATALDENLGDEVFDVSVLCDRSFLIDASRLKQAGYGVDQQASEYLKDTLELISRVNAPFRGDLSQDSPCLVPLLTSGDGNCLAHALSRALVGRELFTHALLTGLHRYIAANWDRLYRLCADFVTDEDKVAVLNECECEGDCNANDNNELNCPMGGLRPLHVFAFSNLLRRPIVLLDSLAGVMSNAEYACLYLPLLCDPSICGSLQQGRFRPNGLLCIAWANAARNHFVPLVGISGKPLPRLPSTLISKAFCSSSQLASQYIELIDVEATLYTSPIACPCCELAADCQCDWLRSPRVCIAGSGRALAAAYENKLVSAMRQQFTAVHQVNIDFVKAYYRQVYRPKCTIIAAINYQSKTLARRLIAAASELGVSFRKLIFCLRQLDQSNANESETVRQEARFSLFEKDPRLIRICAEHEDVKAAMQLRAKERQLALAKYQIQSLYASLRLRLEASSSHSLLSDNPFVTGFHHDAPTSSCASQPSTSCATLVLTSSKPQLTLRTSTVSELANTDESQRRNKRRPSELHDFANTVSCCSAADIPLDSRNVSQLIDLACQESNTQDFVKSNTENAQYLDVTDYTAPVQADSTEQTNTFGSPDIPSLPFVSNTDDRVDELNTAFIE